jgi:hypothetical protein
MPPHAVTIVIHEEFPASRFQQPENVDQRFHQMNLLTSEI